MQFRHFYRKRSGRRKPEKETGWQQQVSLWTWLFFSIKNSQKVLHAQGFWKAHRYYPADDEICPRSERQVPAVSTASPWNQRNSFWISVSSATEYPSFWQMDSICLFGIPVFGFLSSKYRIFDNNWVLCFCGICSYRTKLRTTDLMALPLFFHLFLWWIFFFIFFTSSWIFWKDSSLIVCSIRHASWFAVSGDTLSVLRIY